MRIIVKRYMFEILSNMTQFKLIHLINLDVIEDDFRYDILITGQELYVENEMCFIEYKLAAFNKYLDLNEDRQIIINKIKEGGTLYGE